MLTVVLSFVACNKTNNAVLQSSGNEEGAVLLRQKVLLVVVDGAVGREVKSIAPPVLTGLTNHAIYSWDGLSSYIYDTVSNASTWTSLFAGVGTTKSGVTNSLAYGNFTSYPTLFTRLRSVNPALKTSVFSSSNDIKTYLAKDATVSNSYNQDDNATNTAALSEIKNNDPDLMVVQYHSVDAAGTASSYSATSTMYKNAIAQIDTYIGQLINTVQSRSDYAHENWLIIITSNKGSNTGLANVGSWSAFDDPKHNTFSFFYNSRFVPKTSQSPQGIIPYAGVVPLYTIGGSNSTANPTNAVANSPSTIVFDSLGDYTIQCKIKIPSNQTAQYMGFFGTARYRYDGGAISVGGGWLAYFESSTQYYVNVFTRAGARSQYLVGHNIVDGQWHTIDIVFKWNAAKTSRDGYAVTDGVVGTSKDVKTAYLSATNNPFTVGYTKESSNSGGSTNTKTGVMITDVRIYNTALPTTYIQSNYCSTVVPDSDPYKSNLIGFWPSLDAFQGTDNSYYLKDMSGRGNDLKLNGYASSSFSEQTTSVCPAISDLLYKSVPNVVDAYPLILSWFNIPISSSWQLDGQVFTPSYNDIFN